MLRPHGRRAIGRHDSDGDKANDDSKLNRLIKDLADYRVAFIKGKQR